MRGFWTTVLAVVMFVLGGGDSFAQPTKKGPPKTPPEATVRLKKIESVYDETTKKGTITVDVEVAGKAGAKYQLLVRAIDGMSAHSIAGDELTTIGPNGKVQKSYTYSSGLLQPGKRVTVVAGIYKSSPIVDPKEKAVDTDSLFHTIPNTKVKGHTQTETKF